MKMAKIMKFNNVTVGTIVIHLSNNVLSSMLTDSSPLFHPKITLHKKRTCVL